MDFFRYLYYEWWQYFLYETGLCTEIDHVKLAYEPIVETDKVSPCYTYIVIRNLEKSLHSQAPIEDLSRGYSKLILSNPDMIDYFTYIKVIEDRGLSKRKILRKPKSVYWHDFYQDDKGLFYHGYFDDHNKYILDQIHSRSQQKCQKIRARCDEKLMPGEYIKGAM